IGIAASLLVLNVLGRLGRPDSFAGVLGAVAVAGLYGFVRQEGRAARPIIDPGLFRIAGFAAINLASVLVNLTGFSILLFTPYYLVRVAGLSLPAAGALLAASFAGTIGASPVAGRLIGRVAANRVALLGAGLGAVGLVLIGGWSLGSSWQTAAV